jgi:hypothetical protein
MKQDLANTVHQLEQKIQRIERQLTDQRSSSTDQSPEGNIIMSFGSLFYFYFFKQL